MPRCWRASHWGIKEKWIASRNCTEYTSSKTNVLTESQTKMLGAIIWESLKHFCTVYLNDWSQKMSVCQYVHFDKLICQNLIVKKMKCNHLAVCQVFSVTKMVYQAMNNVARCLSNAKASHDTFDSSANCTILNNTWQFFVLKRIFFLTLQYNLKQKCFILLFSFKHFNGDNRDKVNTQSVCQEERANYEGNNF